MGPTLAPLVLPTPQMKDLPCMPRRPSMSPAQIGPPLDLRSRVCLLILHAPYLDRDISIGSENAPAF